MKKLLVTLLTLTVLNTFASKLVPHDPWEKSIVDKKIILLGSGKMIVGNSDGRGASVASSAVDGFLKHASGTITSAALVAAGTGVPVLIGPVIPDNSVVIACFYEVATTFLGDGDDTSEISIGLEDQDNDVVIAAAIKTGTPWDAAVMQETILKIETSTTFLKLTAARQIAVTLDIIATDTTLTAGSMDVSCMYMAGI